MKEFITSNIYTLSFITPATILIITVILAAYKRHVADHVKREMEEFREEEELSDLKIDDLIN